MGAAVSMEDLPPNAAQEAAIAMAGPIVGSMAACVPMWYGLATGSQLGFALAHWGFMINLFNLLPFGNLDGGRVAGALSHWFLLLGLAGCGALVYTMPMNPVLMLIFFAGSYTTFIRFYSPEWRPYGYYNLSPLTKTAIGVSYLGLIAALVLAMKVNDSYRRTPQELLPYNSGVRKQLNDVDNWL